MAIWAFCNCFASLRSRGLRLRHKLVQTPAAASQQTAPIQGSEDNARCTLTPYLRLARPMAVAPPAREDPVTRRKVNRLVRATFPNRSTCPRLNRLRRLATRECEKRRMSAPIALCNSGETLYSASSAGCALLLSIRDGLADPQEPNFSPAAAPGCPFSSAALKYVIMRIKIALLDGIVL